MAEHTENGLIQTWKETLSEQQLMNGELQDFEETQ